MSVNGSDNDGKKSLFTPPGSYFQSKQMEGRAPSNNPSLSTLTAKQQDINLPDLLACIRTWHQGKNFKNQNGVKVACPWFVIEVIHLDTSTVIHTHECDISEEDEEVYSIIKNRIENRARGMGDGDLQRFEIRCHFRSEDGEITGWEPFTVPIKLPPTVSQYGQPHYGGMGGNGFGGGGGGFGGNGFGGGGGGLANINNQHAVFVRGNIDSAHRSDIVLMRAIDMIENHARRLEASNARHEDRADTFFRLMEDMYDRTAQRRRDDQMQELKMAALQAAVEKVLHTLPLGLGIFNKWIKVKVEEKQGKVTSREAKALDVLKRVMKGLEKGPAAQNPEMVKGLLKNAGVNEETIEDTFSLFQEFAIDNMIEKAETETKHSLLGSDGSENNGLQKLLNAVRVKKDDDNNDSVNTENKTDVK